MTIAQTYHDFIERYDEKEGLDSFISSMYFYIETGVETLDNFNLFCDAMIDEKAFPNCLTWCEIKREMNKEINQ